VEVEVDERLREMSFGVLEGKRFWDLFREDSALMRSWLADPLRNPLPTQESMWSFEKRTFRLVYTNRLCHLRS